MKNSKWFWIFSLLIIFVFSTACSTNVYSNTIPEDSSVIVDVETENQHLPLASEQFVFSNSQKKDLLPETELTRPTVIPECKKLSLEEIEKECSEKLLTHYFQDTAGKQLHEVILDAPSKTIKWDYGWFESEYEAHYSGNYTENNGCFDCTFTGKKKDGGIMTEIGTPLHLTFEAFVPTETLSEGGLDIVISITETDIPEFEELIHQPLVFSSENPDPYPVRNAQFIFRYTNETTEKQLSTIADEQVVLNGDLMELETLNSVRFLMGPADESNLLKDAFVENLDLKGKTASDIPYRVFVRDHECQANVWRREYHVLFKTTEEVCFQAVLIGQKHPVDSSEKEDFQLACMEEYKNEFYPILQAIQLS